MTSVFSFIWLFNICFTALKVIFLVLGILCMLKYLRNS